MAVDRERLRRVGTETEVRGISLAQAISSGKIAFSPPTEPSSKEFQALINLVNPERRSEKFYKELSRHGYVWSIELDNQLLAFDIQDKRGKICNAVPFWPAKEYAAYVAQLQGGIGVPRKIDILEFLNQVLLICLPSRKLLAALFWLPGKRTVIESPRALAKERTETFLRRCGIERFARDLQKTDEEYRIALKEAYRRPMKCGPKGKLP